MRMGMAEEKPTNTKPVKLSKEDSDVILRMTKAFVYGAITNGSSGGEIDRVVTFADACNFWGFPSQVKLGEVDKHIEKVAGFLKGLLHSFQGWQGIKSRDELRSRARDQGGIRPGEMSRFSVEKV
jgi:hypothetical protein